MTLNTALEIAQAAEATQSQLKQMQNLHEVNAVGKKKRKFFRKKQEEKKKSANGSTQQIDCKFCGRKHVPDRSKCPAYGQQCNKCGKSNHFAAKCTGGSHSSRNLHANQNLNYVQEDSDGSQFEEYTIDVITYQVSAVEEKKHPKQLFTSVKVNNAKDVTFQLDCGATCNLLSLKEFSSIMGDPKDLYLKKTSAILKMYNGTTVTPLGKCTLKCAKGEMSRDADFFITDEDVRPLLGAETCQELNLIKVMASDISESETVNAVNDKVQTAHIVLTRDQILKEYSDIFERLV